MSKVDKIPTSTTTTNTRLFKDTRSKAERQMVPSYSFFGQGSYIEVDVGDTLPYGLTRIKLSFATPRKFGFLFLAMHLQYDDAIYFKDDLVNFYALQLENGYLVSVFDFGEGVRRIVHTKAGRLSDNKLHNVTVRTKRKFTRLWVDSQKKKRKVSDVALSTQPYFRVSKIFIGGLPLKKRVTPSR